SPTTTPSTSATIHAATAALRMTLTATPTRRETDMPRTFTVPRGVIRAATGLLLTAGVVVTVTALSTRLMPEVTRPVPSFTVDTAGSTHDTLVCPGSFAVLGVNPNSPNDAVGAGKATVTVSDTDATATALEQEFPGEQA